jgi:tetratricopeptide (TPR) repeat protein
LRDPLVSLCMIVRDEEGVLERCLRSVAEYVDEIVVVDTGSTDRTPEVARSFRAQVIRRDWSDDFSEARNASLAAASGRFVLVLDADEWLESGPEPGAFRERLRKTDREAFTVEIADRRDRGTLHRYPLVRLFRNRPGHRYAGAFHEQITPSIARTLGVDLVPGEPCGLVVGHDGYVERVRRERGKAERNLAMLAKCVEASPDDPSARYFLARENIPVRGGRAVPGSHLEEALGHLEHPACSDLSPALAADAARLRAAALLALGRAKDARKVLEESGDLGVACELLRADAEIAMAQRDPDLVGSALERISGCFDRETRDRGPCSDPALAGPVARAHAAEALLLLDRLEEARRLAGEATALPGGGASAWNALAAVERSSGLVPAALKTYLRGLREDESDPWAWAGIGETLLEAGDPAGAVDPLRNAATLAPGWKRVEDALASALLLSAANPG